jgi:hypothetical protein
MCTNAPYHPNRSTADELDNQAGHTHALPREDRAGMAPWIPHHPGKRRVRMAIKDAILSDEKST